ncbi:uncharacterized protein [Melopsittacus undulatus]|uniref:uncharacterized protein isoform X1 n=1 Tax=Melopsittacus undulatus TaxID=13146 RepID=UPI00146C2FD3|nr:uncharacterized protein LOC117437017 isoform X1 [Melopsittacus undulatus]
MAPIKWHQCTPPPRARPCLPSPHGGAEPRSPPAASLPSPHGSCSRTSLCTSSMAALWRRAGRGGAGGGRRRKGTEWFREEPTPPIAPPAGHGSARLSPDRHGSARPRVEPGHRGGLGQAGSRRGAVAGGRRCCPGLQRGPCPPSHPSCRRHSCSPRPLRVTVSTATAAAAAAARTRHPPPARRHHRGLWEQRAAMCTLCVPEQTLSRAPEDFFSLFLSSARPKRKERFLQLGSRRRERRSPVSS